jgi:hypothetical protein
MPGDGSFAFLKLLRVIEAVVLAVRVEVTIIK